MKKVLCVFLTTMMFFVMSIPAFASPVTSEQTTLSDEMIQMLSPQDHVNCYDVLLEYKNNNPVATDADLNRVATEFYITVCQDKLQSSNSRIYSGGGLNSDELEMARQYPADLAAYGSAGQMALTTAGNRYWGGSFYSNQDAFRHAAWNALLVCRFYALGRGDVDECITRTRLWTDAHESGATKTEGQSDAQWAVEQEMDYINNIIGRAIAETTYTSESVTIRTVQEYVDNGLCKRIKTDEQTTWLPERMFVDVPVWSLRATSTYGKM